MKVLDMNQVQEVNGGQHPGDNLSQQSGGGGGAALGGASIALGHVGSKIIDNVWSNVKSAYNKVTKKKPSSNVCHQHDGKGRCTSGPR